MLGAIFGGLGAVSGLFGGLGKNKALERQKAAIEAQKNENQNWYDRRYNEDATQRADAQRILQLTEESIKNRNRAAAGTAAVMGGTEESVAAAKAAGNQTAADAASQIAAAGAARKDQIENKYIERKNSLNDKINELEAQKKSPLDLVSDAIGGGAAGYKAGWEMD